MARQLAPLLFLALLLVCFAEPIPQIATSTSSNNTVSSIASTGSGGAYVTQCANAWSTYTSLTSAWYQSNTLHYVYNTSYVTNYSAEVTTLCDDVPRIFGSLTPTASYPVTTSKYTRSSYPGATPCSIDASDCANLWSTWQSESATHTGSWPPSTIIDPLDLECYSTVAVGSSSTTSSDCGKCTIAGGHVKLMYFSKAATRTDLCATTSDALTTCPFGPTTAPLVTTASECEYGACPTQCNYAKNTTQNLVTTGKHAYSIGPYTVYEGQTLYEGNIYMSFTSVWAIDRCNHVVNGTAGYTDVILPVPSTGVYSVRSGWESPGTVFAGYSFNYDDLATVPSSIWYSSYSGGEPWGSYTVNSRAAIDGKTMDEEDRYSTILQEAYAPLLMLPPQIRSLDPGWADCDLYIDGLQDEPVQITATADLPMVETSQAAPVSSVASATPTPTVV